MSQVLNFFKQQILDEDEAQKMNQKEVFAKIKSILDIYDVENEDEVLQEVFFKQVIVPSIQISAYEERMEKLLSDVQFIPEESRRFMMNEKVWSVLEEIIYDQCRMITGEKKSKNDNKCSQNLDNLFKISQDFYTLKQLFKRHSLFVNIL
jgi:hypothetical protein